METNFQWVISQLNCAVESEGLANVINVIHYRYNATKVDGDKTYFAEIYGSSSVAQPNPQNFTNSSDVTEEEVIGWLEKILPVEDMKLGLEANIALQINPVEVTLPLPWATVPPVVEPIVEPEVEPVVEPTEPETEPETEPIEESPAES
jgi:hypothetical protein